VGDVESLLALAGSDVSRGEGQNTLYSDATMRRGWQMAVYAHRFFHFDVNQNPLPSSTGQVKVYFLNPIISVFYPGRGLRFDYDIRREGNEIE
jgi:hypothetical protein